SSTAGNANKGAYMAATLITAVSRRDFALRKVRQTLAVGKVADSRVVRARRQPPARTDHGNQSSVGDGAAAVGAAAVLVGPDGGDREGAGGQGEVADILDWEQRPDALPEKHLK